MIAEVELTDDRLQILGPCPWWGEAVRAGRLVGDDGGEVPVAVVLGPEVDDPEAPARARDRAWTWLGRRAPGILPLLAVVGAEGRVAWVYEACDAVSAAVLVADAGEAGGAVPLRVCTEVVAACAEVLERLHAGGLSHPGLTAEDALVGPDGSVRIAGFVGPFAQAPVHRDPRGVDDAGAAVWRLGVLLAELLTGAPPVPATDPPGHELMIRRLLVRIMSRPGPILPERYGDWLRGMLAWDGDQRPVLARVAPGLRELAALLPPPTLAEAALRVPDLRVRPPVAPVSADTGGTRWLHTELRADTPSPAERTERTEEASLGEVDEMDEVTAVSLDGDPPHRVPAPPEHGAIPVQVGPPPEVAKRRTRLPEGLFDRPSPREPTDVLRNEAERRRWAEAGAAASVLLVVAVGLVWYLWS